MIVGLGLNVNIPADRFPREIRHQATSILAETGTPFPRLCSCAVTWNITNLIMISLK